MANITLAVKYRPTTFDDVVEQSAITAILTEQIKTNSFKRAYLFCGPAGCGKTTCARIFAKEINGGKGNPIEIDAASNNSVDDVREIIDQAKLKAIDAPYKVYILDECHMFSTGAWNAMLKLLEEPPASAVFIMCTTDPQKIPATILSRVQRFDFSKITHTRIVERLKYILAAENSSVDAPNRFTYDIGALEYIAKLANGGMRDAISMLDKCLSYNTNLTLENAIVALGDVDYDIYFDFMLSLACLNAMRATEIIEQIYYKGVDLKTFVKQFMSFMVEVCKFRIFSSFEYVTIPDTPNYRTWMYQEDEEALKDILNLMLKLNTEVKWETNPKALIEASIIMFISERV